jgi:hypothetical protein
MDESAMADGAVGQLIEPAVPRELEVVLGNVQACVDSRVPGVRTPSCMRTGPAGLLDQRFELKDPGASDSGCLRTG